MPWVVNASGERTLMTTLGLRQRTRKLRNKLNKIEPSTSGHIQKFSADLPLAGRQSAGANGEGDFSHHHQEDGADAHHHDR